MCAAQLQGTAMSTKQMEITDDELASASFRYCDAVAELPPTLRWKMPSFHEFLSPAHTTNFNQDWISLSMTGTQRYKMLQSPHVVTLLAIYAAQRFDTNQNEGYEM